MKTRRKGFTLIEVVVALAILGVGLVAVIELFGGGLRSGRAAEEYTKAAGYARMKMEEIYLSKTLEEGIQDGRFDRDYRWSVEIRKVDLLPAGRETETSLPIDLYLVRVDVTWRSGLREKSTAIETYRVCKAEPDARNG